MTIKKRIVPIKEKVAYAGRLAYRWVMQVAAEKGYRAPISSGWYNDLLRAWKVGDVVVGDLIAIQDRVLILAGMNRNGGPGQALYAQAFGMSTPEFIPSTPWERRVWTSFDTLYFPSWSKVGHRSKEEWDGMLKDSFNRMLPVVI